MENFKQRPRPQPLLFASEEDDTFDLEDFLKNLLVKTDLFDVQPIFKRKDKDKDKDEDKGKTKDEPEEQLLKFLVKKFDISGAFLLNKDHE